MPTRIVSKKVVERLAPHLAKLYRDLQPDHEPNLDLDVLLKDFQRLSDEPNPQQLHAFANEIRTAIAKIAEDSPETPKDSIKIPMSNARADALATALEAMAAKITAASDGSLPMPIHDSDRTRFAERHMRSLAEVERVAFAAPLGLGEESRTAFATLVGWDQRYLRTVGGQLMLREAQIANDKGFLDAIGKALVKNERYQQTKQVPHAQSFMIRVLRALTYGGRRTFDNPEYAREVYDRLKQIWLEVDVMDPLLLKLVHPGTDGRWRYFYDTFLVRNHFRQSKKRVGLT